jgi:formate dehydrogenase subunit gamma
MSTAKTRRNRKMPQEVQRYPKMVRVLHWVHAGSFSLLFLTGLVLFLPPLAFLAEDGWTRVVHRVASVVFIVAPVIYFLLDWKGSVRGIKEAFNWGPADIGWLRAAPRYYFLCDETVMPDQPHMNSGQKMWWLMSLVFGVVFGLTGIIMWVLKDVAPPLLMQWMVILHDVAFIATGVMFFVHIYLSVLHPLMRHAQGGAWESMARGTVSTEYVASHHRQWYKELVRANAEENDDAGVEVGSNRAKTAGTG